ncbi:MAG TPA: hypothetical protein VGK33_16340 [Chloroflexota bacterium]
MADLALQERLRPDTEASAPVQYSSTPSALVNEAIRRSRIGELVEGRQWRLDEMRGHASSRGNNGG